MGWILNVIIWAFIFSTSLFLFIGWVKEKLKYFHYDLYQNKHYKYSPINYRPKLSKYKIQHNDNKVESKNYDFCIDLQLPIVIHKKYQIILLQNC